MTLSNQRIQDDNLRLSSGKDPIDHRNCRQCHKHLPLTDFPVYRVGEIHGHRHSCRRCYRTQCLLVNARHRSRKKGLEFDLTMADLTIPTHCPILGMPLAFTEGESDWSPSLDRIDPTKGYVRSNVQVLSWRANQLKRNASLEELQQLGEWATNFKLRSKPPD